MPSTCGHAAPVLRRGLCENCYRRALRNGRADQHALKLRPFEALLAEVESLGPDACWPWPGTVHPHGYGRFHNQQAHRAAYTRLIGPIPDGLDLDHLCHVRDETCRDGPACRHRRCVNPSHLAPRTRHQNVNSGRWQAGAERVTACRRYGHPYTEENTHRRTDGKRECRQCILIRRARYAAAHRRSSPS